MDMRSAGEYIAFRAAFGALRRMPYRRAEDLLRRLGHLTGSRLRVRRGVVLAQLERVYPDAAPEQLERWADGVYDHLGRTVAEVFCGDTQELLSRTSADPGFAALDQALAGGRGAIVVTGHIGNFELGGAFLARRYALLDVVKPQRNQAFDRYIQKLRHARGIRTVPVDRSVPVVLRHLRGGGLVSLLLDQDAGAQGVVTDFLGHPASTWPGAARLSLRTGCAVVPVAMQRLPDSRHVMHIGDAIWPNGETDDAAGVAAYLGRISRAVETYIRQTPDQWFWVHRRWKGAGEAGAAP